MNFDRYNLLVFINKGNIVFVNGDYEKVVEFYKEVLRNDFFCIEVFYNIGK